MEPEITFYIKERPDQKHTAPKSFADQLGIVDGSTIKQELATKLGRLLYNSAIDAFNSAVPKVLQVDPSVKFPEVK